MAHYRAKCPREDCQVSPTSQPVTPAVAEGGAQDRHNRHEQRGIVTVVTKSSRSRRRSEGVCDGRDGRVGLLHPLSHGGQPGARRYSPDCLGGPSADTSSAGKATARRPSSPTQTGLRSGPVAPGTAKGCSPPLRYPDRVAGEHPTTTNPHHPGTHAGAVRVRSQLTYERDGKSQ